MSRSLTEPALPSRLTVSSMAAYKRALRHFDSARIASGLATPEQITAENSFLPQGRYNLSFDRVTTASVRRILSAAR
jgi:hypothetical protein